MFQGREKALRDACGSLAVVLAVLAAWSLPGSLVLADPGGSSYNQCVQACVAEYGPTSQADCEAGCNISWLYCGLHVSPNCTGWCLPLFTCKDVYNPDTDDWSCRCVR